MAHGKPEAKAFKYKNIPVVILIKDNKGIVYIDKKRKDIDNSDMSRLAAYARKLIDQGEDGILHNNMR